MRGKSIKRGSPTRLDRWTSPALFGLAAWLIFPSLPGKADLAEMLSGFDRAGSQWRMVLTDSPAGSLHAAELAFPEGEERLARGAGMSLPDGRRIAFAAATKAGDEASTDEERVNRSIKRGRVIAVERMQPPKDFTAGSVLQRQSSLLLPPAASGERTALAKPGKAGNEIKLAAFYFRKKEEKPREPDLSPMVASLVTNTHADSLATAFAPQKPDFSRQSPFDAILKKPEEGRFVPEIGPKDHAWAATALPAEVFSAAEQQCLSSGIYFEARGESVKGQAAVAQVILNRVRNPAYPKTICGVVYQNEDWRNRCQFSFACDDIKDRIRSEEHWKMAREVAIAVTAGKIWLPEVGSATHYHAVYVRPKWARSMEKVGRIGLHIFYRTYGGGWS